jgi:5'(3')-deoxyribonucleotidase
VKPVFLLDVDEVLADFSGPAARVMSSVLGRPWTIAEAPTDEWDMFSVLTEDQYRVVSAIIDAPGWCSEIKPLPGSREFVDRLRVMCRVFPVTAPRLFAEQWTYERAMWLQKHFDFDPEDVVHTHAKYLVDGDFLLDDKPHFVEEWVARHPAGVGMLWSTPHNARLGGYEKIRVHSKEVVYQQILDRIER